MNPSDRLARRCTSALALLLVPAALVSCDAIKQKLGGGATASLAFTPSNVDLTGMDLSKIGDFKVDDPSCSLSSEELLASCGNGGEVLAFKLAKQADGSPIAVYVARSIRIPAKMMLTIQGRNPIALIALDTIEIRGSLIASATGDTATAGGHGPTRKDNARGAGPGGGSAASAVTAGGGGAHCGKGGAGASEVGKAGAPPRAGAPYGAASLAPLLGGSAGGAAAAGAGGAGGGAVQLIAKTSITIAAGGVVNAGGGGGEFGGEASGQEAAGGGSGGSILLEAQDVSVSGTLAANGGGGGSGTSSNIPSGANATGNATPAPGGASNGVSPGGSGSGGGRIDGANGTASPDKTAGGGGGGGGAGRIRIHTKSGVATLTGGTLSPAATTTCTTQGKLAVAK